MAPEVTRTDYSVPVEGGEILGRWYTRGGVMPGSAVVYFHGGGLIAGSVQLHDRTVASYVHATGGPFLSVDYRLVPEQGVTTPADDGYAGLIWLLKHASELGVDPGRVAVLGDSGGGQVAAGAAIRARNNETVVAKQVLIYPMPEDRNVIPDANLAPFATWTYDNNYTGWHALLGDGLGSETTSSLVSSARLVDFRGLAPAYIDVGELDIFRDESIAYAACLLNAGVSAELHVHPGAPHGFDTVAPQSAVAIRAHLDRRRVLTAR